jgi:hypothetical protein
LPWLLASLALSLITDVLRRFLSAGWPDTAAPIVQYAFVVLAIVAAVITIMSMMRPTHPLVVKASGSFHLNAPQKVQRAVILTGIALVIVLGLWQSLPVFARYYNERGAGFQYREQPNAPLTSVQSALLNQFSETLKRCLAHSFRHSMLRQSQF